MDCSLPGSSIHGDSPGKKTRLGCRALLQGIFLTQGSNLGLLRFRQILYHLSHQGSLNLYHQACRALCPGGSVVKNLPANAGDEFDPWWGKIPHALEQLSQCSTTIEPVL